MIYILSAFRNFIKKIIKNNFVLVRLARNHHWEAVKVSWVVKIGFGDRCVSMMVTLQSVYDTICS